MSGDQTRFDKESAFHDRWADSQNSSTVKCEAFFESVTAVENRFVLSTLGDLHGKKLLDIGCGLGESCVFFATKGAVVAALDISPGMIQHAKKLAALYNVQIDAQVSPAEGLPFPDGTFDIVYAANVLHHVADKRAFFTEARRVLRVGGRFVSWDPVAYNPVINVYRRLATEVRTDDEAPLKLGDVALAQAFFPGAQARTFWIASLVLFLRYFMVDRVHPNKDRYWKRIYQPQPLWWWKPFAWLDACFLCRLPGIRWLAWNVVILGKKQS